MSVSVGGWDITQYVNQGGISEGIEGVYSSDSSSSSSESEGGEEEEQQLKGVHYTYTISARVPAGVKEYIDSCVQQTAVSCYLDGESFSAEVSGVTASIYLERGDTVWWDISFTMTDTALINDESEGTA